MDAEMMSELVSVQLTTTLGSVFLGFACTCVLYGITSLQTWMYFDYDFKDEPMLSRTVLFLWILDTLQVLFLAITVYRNVVVDFGNLPALLTPTWSLAAMVILVSNLIVRAIFGMRIWKLSGGHWFIPVCIVNVLSLFVLGDGIFFAVKGLSVPTLFEVHWSFYTGFSAEVVADTIITVSQCMLLVRMKTGFERTDSLISVMMRYSINTGLLTSICAILVLITYSTQPNNFVYMAFYFVYSKLYVNSLLATLNARRSRLMRQNLGVQRVAATSVTDMTFKADAFDLSRPAELTTIIDIGSRLANSSESHEF
ncbi:uncharacterized protein TRAVEDRAFT_53430 [Trametes versicolor FP-101664 SS1]|uniref:uncharacterized protein n=1 Tax=Trametes versicolor (strain FP-101664) TaxID=717944 RepID=UPI0004621904|nr:uncharacterized protein TRAVEDRAFT_53430 [Trametes versicolor FP-101664 SS1]EIW53013.1 hypothetical protein TRAVEDRAFT_53430 [Trametes versicolor FP-101664 SS1]